MNDKTNSGPIKFLPAPRDAALSRLCTEKLAGHATSDQWLPAGLSVELDELAAEHLRVRDRVVKAGEEVISLEQRFRDEDATHEEALREAHRDDAQSVNDERMPEDQREAELAKARAGYWAGVRVLAEVVDRAHAYIQEAEDDLLAGLRSQRAARAEEKREAQRRLREAEVAEWGLAQMGQWIQKTTDGEFHAQPAPTPSAPPPTFNEQTLDRALERPWFRTPEAREELPTPWLDQDPEAEQHDVEPLSPEDETGAVSELTPDAGARA